MPHLQKRRDLCLTEGPVLKKIVYFAFPLMCTNILQILYNAADMIVVGQFSTVEGAVGAIGSTSALINLQLNLVFGIAVGANVVVANAIGARDEERTRRAVHTSIWTGLICGLIGAVIGLIFSKPLLLWMDADPALIDMSVLYTRIYFLGVPFTGVLNYAISVLRAKGDTKTPLYVMSLAGILNVILNIIFVAGFGMNVDGVAIATATSNAVSVIAILIKMSRDQDWCRFEMARMKHIDVKMVRKIIRIGVPAGIQASLFSLSNVFIQRSINGFGTAVVNGNAICVNLEGIAYTTANSITQASITFTGQNIGAKRYDRLGMIIRDCYLVAVAVGVAFSGMLFLFREPLFMLYMNAEDSLREATIAAATVRAYYVVIPYFLLSFMDVGGGISRGMGYSTLSMIISLLGACGFRIAWIYTIFAWYPELWVLYLSLPVSWMLTGTAFLFANLWIRKNYLRSQQKDAPSLA